MSRDRRRRTQNLRPAGDAQTENRPTLPAELVHIDRAIPGGAMFGRLRDGRVALVTGGLPGESVMVALRKGPGGVLTGSCIPADITATPSPVRVSPPCPQVAEGCGGCDWQHIDPIAQPGFKVEAVADALRRIGKVVDPQLSTGPALPSEGYRTTVRAVVNDVGQAGLRAAQSHRLVPLDWCLVAHPAVAHVLQHGRFPGWVEVTVRTSAATGKVIVLADLGENPSSTVDKCSVPDGVIVADRRDASPPSFTEGILGTTLRVSAPSFFQSRADGAAVLVEAVMDLAGDVLSARPRVADLYCGVGLFAATLANRFDLTSVVGVEWNRWSAADARHNLAAFGGSVIEGDAGSWRGNEIDLVVADPARIGLEKSGVAAATSAQPEVIIVVSCDAGALGRDTFLLATSGYRFDRAIVVDMFPHTHHVEVVSRFVRTGSTVSR